MYSRAVSCSHALREGGMPKLEDSDISLCGCDIMLWKVGGTYRKMKTPTTPSTMVWMIRIQVEMEKRDMLAVVLGVGLSCC